MNDETHIAVFYDGLTARRRTVMVAIDGEFVTITDNDAVLARWPFGDLRIQGAPTGSLRLSAIGAPDLARLELAAGALADEILRRSPHIVKAARASHMATAKIVFWSSSAAVSLFLTAAFLLPIAADRLTPLVPISWERWLGGAVDNQVRALFGDTPCSTPAGTAALGLLEDKLSAATALPLPIEIRVLPSVIPNAVALPGGRIYVLSGLLDYAQNSDEVIGVIAHEVGHVAHRDGLRRLLQSSGSSFLLGLLFGDVVGGGALAMSAQMLVNSAYSREAEADADRFAAELLIGLGRSPAPLGEFLRRLTEETGGESRALALVSSHPLSDDRTAALSRSEPVQRGAPLLSDAEWQALKAICPEEVRAKAQTMRRDMREKRKRQTQ